MATVLFENTDIGHKLNENSVWDHYELAKSMLNVANKCNYMY